MKKHWLRGVLLGASLALLLAGGVALAQSLRVWPDCFQCLPGAVVTAGLPEGPYYYNWESCGWGEGQALYYRETFANGALFECPGPFCPGLIIAEQNGCALREMWSWPCEMDAVVGQRSIEASVGPVGEWPEDFWGPFEICVSPLAANPEEVSADQMVCETIRFAEVCEPEFVPEPGSIVLLGGGLMGLAGYATLRWRTRD